MLSPKTSCFRSQTHPGQSEFTSEIYFHCPSPPAVRFNGWGVTAFDSLDTMILLGFDEEFKRALELVRKTKFVPKTDDYAPFFETVIRYLGGLMSAYALSNEPILLEKADELARVLSPAFNSSTGFPYYAVAPAS